MKRISVAIALLSMITLLAAAPAPLTAVNGKNCQPPPCPCEPCFPDDPQAYLASAWVPSLRPQVVLGSLAVITVITILLLNNQDSHSHH